MSKKKLNTNGTLLNLLLLGGAAVILKKRTGSLRGVGAMGGYIKLSGNPYKVKKMESFLDTTPFLEKVIDPISDSQDREIAYNYDSINQANLYADILASRLLFKGYKIYHDKDRNGTNSYSIWLDTNNIKDIIDDKGSALIRTDYGKGIVWGEILIKK